MQMVRKRRPQSSQTRSPPSATPSPRSAAFDPAPVLRPPPLPAPHPSPSSPPTPPAPPRLSPRLPTPRSSRSKNTSNSRFSCPSWLPAANTPPPPLLPRHTPAKSHPWPLTTSTSSSSSRLHSRPRAQTLTSTTLLRSRPPLRLSTLPLHPSCPLSLPTTSPQAHTTTSPSPSSTTSNSSPITSPSTLLLPNTSLTAGRPPLLARVTLPLLHHR